MACITCIHLNVKEHPMIQWYCRKNNKAIKDIYSFPDWCPNDDVIDDD